MSQTHLGYTSWNSPPRNTMPAVTEIQVSKAAAMGVAVEGSEQPSRGGARLTLPALDVFGKQPRYLEVFNRGREPFEFTITASDPWITLSKGGGRVTGDERIFVNARWADVPLGADHATLTIGGPDNRTVTVLVPVHNPPTPRPEMVKGFVETHGVVAIEAEHYSRAVAPPSRSWLRIPDHGRTLSGMTTLPVEAPATSLTTDGMRLEYGVHLFTAGKTKVLVTLAPTQKFQPGAGLRYGISFDDEPVQVVNIHADESRAAWGRTVADGAATFTTEHTISRPGSHTLKFWALDPGVVVQKLVVDAGGLRPSYLGPPESPRLP